MCPPRCICSCPNRRTKKDDATATIGTSESPSCFASRLGAARKSFGQTRDGAIDRTVQPRTMTSISFDERASKHEQTHIAAIKNETRIIDLSGKTDLLTMAALNWRGTAHGHGRFRPRCISPPRTHTAQVDLSEPTKPLSRRPRKSPAIHLQGKRLSRSLSSSESGRAFP